MAACRGSSAVFRSGALNIDRTLAPAASAGVSAATSSLICCLGKYAPAFCCKWNWHLCQGKLPNTARWAAPWPLWSSLVISFTPFNPRSFKWSFQFLPEWFFLQFSAHIPPLLLLYWFGQLCLSLEFLSFCCANFNIEMELSLFSTLSMGICDCNQVNSRFGKIDNACYNQFIIEWDAKASKKINDSLFFIP